MHTLASAYASHAEGFQSAQHQAGIFTRRRISYTIAFGIASHAEGALTIASRRLFTRRRTARYNFIWNIFTRRRISGTTASGNCIHTQKAAAQ
jgi:hypothetical protein